MNLEYDEVFKILENYDGYEWEVSDYPEVIKMVDLVEGGIYLVEADSFDVAIYYGESFIGIRDFPEGPALNPEVHVDRNKKHGTVKPRALLEVIEIQETSQIIH